MRHAIWCAFTIQLGSLQVRTLLCLLCHEVLWNKDASGHTAFQLATLLSKPPHGLCMLLVAQPGKTAFHSISLMQYALHTAQRSRCCRSRCHISAQLVVLPPHKMLLNACSCSCLSLTHSREPLKFAETQLDRTRHIWLSSASSCHTLECCAVLGSMPSGNPPTSSSRRACQTHS